MKYALAFTTVLLLLAPVLPTTSFIASPAAATEIVRHPKPHPVVIKKPAHRVTVIRRTVGHPNRVVWHRPPVRPGQFWHRGSWFGRVHRAAFHYPRGWHHRVWVVGAILPALFLTPEYFYDDYVPLGLQAPAPGYRWIRYGEDLLLVNLRTGEVEDVAYDVFD